MLKNKPKNKSLPKKTKTVTKTSKSSTAKKLLPGGNRVEKRARRLTNGIVRGEVADLRRQSGEVTRAAATADAGTESRYQRGIGDLNHVRGEVTDLINQTGAQNRATYNTAKVEQTAAQAALQSQLGSIYGGNSQGAQSGLDALGIGGMGGGFLGQLQNDQQFSQAQAAQGGANTQANLGLADANSAGLSGLLAGMAQGSYQSNMGQNLNSRNDALAETAGERDNQMAAINEAIAEARGSRKDVFLELMTQLEQSPWGQNMKQRNSSQSSKSKTVEHSGSKGKSLPKNKKGNILGPDKKKRKYPNPPPRA